MSKINRLRRFSFYEFRCFFRDFLLWPLHQLFFSTFVASVHSKPTQVVSLHHSTKNLDHAETGLSKLFSPHLKTICRSKLECLTLANIFCQVQSYANSLPREKCTIKCSTRVGSWFTRKHNTRLNMFWRKTR